MKKDPKTMNVVVDTKEPKARTEDYEDTYSLVLKYYPNASQLPTKLGDIIYEGCGFELKTFSDFIQSIMENRGERFRNQLLDMKNNLGMDWYYVIYGKWSDINKYSKINITAILGAIASINAHYGIRVLIMPNKKYAIYTVCKIIEKYHDGKIQKPVLHQATTGDRAINSLSCMADKLGESKAVKILEHFGTLQKVINANINNLKNVKGIGNAIAERIVETRNKDFSKKKETEDNSEIDNKILMKDFIDFDPKKDKVKTVETKKESPKKNTIEGLIMLAISKYINTKFKPVPRTNLINAIIRKKKYNKNDIVKALKYLETENHIYREKSDANDVYYNIYEVYHLNET